CNVHRHVLVRSCRCLGAWLPFPCPRVPLLLSIDFYQHPACSSGATMKPSFCEVAKNGTLHPRLIGRWGNGVYDYKAANSPSSLSYPALLSLILYLSSATDNEISGVSFQPNNDATDDSNSREASNSIELTTPESTCLPDHHSRPSICPKRPMCCPADASILPDFSDDPDDDIDEDITNVPLDYGRSEKTKVRADTPLKWDDLIEALREVTPNDVHRFFNYCMKLKYGEGGRHLKGTSKGIRKLIEKFDLDTQERGKEPVYLCLFNILGIYTVNRLHTLLALQFHYLRFSIQDNPDGGPPVLLVEIRSKHTKRFLETSQMYISNNFPFPKIINDPSLVFSPYTFIFGILFWLQGFEVPALSSIGRLRKLFV
ncbi:unnamed protein product, partial [Penicillium salamii]